MEVSEWMAVEELLQLDLALVARETEVHVEDMDRAIDVVVTHAQDRVQHAPALLPAQREIDVDGFDDRIAREDRVAVLAAAADVDVREPRAMREAELLAEQIDLHVLLRARHSRVDLLQHEDVDVELANHVDDARRIVSAIDAADALVNVVAEDAKPHAVLAS